MLAAALAGALVFAVAAIMYSTAPGTEPRAAQRPPARPSLDQPLREAVAPALRADARLSTQLSSLVPGADPTGALDRLGAAAPATDAALVSLRGLRARTAEERLLRDRARRALSTQADYLEVVRAALRLRATAQQLDALGPISSRLVSRLELIETAVPRASKSVGGARRLKLWVKAETAATQPPPATLPVPVPPAPTHSAPPLAPAPTPTATATATPSPAPTATPTPTATPEPATWTEPRARRLHPRRARLRERLEAAGAL